MNRIWEFFHKWGWLLFFGGMAVFLKPRGRGWWRTVKEEHKFIDVRAKTQALIEDRKYYDAVQHVKTQYQDKLAKMDEDNRAMVSHLEADPEQLASYLAALHL